MPVIPIECLACGIKFSESQYIKHMEIVHNGQSSGQAMAIAKAKEQNVPKEIPLDKNAPPSQEFMEVAKMMDQSMSSVKVEAQLSSPIWQEEKKAKDMQPLKLTYKWEGQCSTCGNTVKTIVVRDTAVAWCLHCDEQKKEQDVEPLRNFKIEKNPIEERILARRKEMKSHAKRKSIVQRKASIQTEMPNSGMSKIN